MDTIAPISSSLCGEVGKYSETNIDNQGRYEDYMSPASDKSR